MSIIRDTAGKINAAEHNSLICLLTAIFAERLVLGIVSDIGIITTELAVAVTENQGIERTAGNSAPGGNGTQSPLETGDGFMPSLGMLFIPASVFARASTRRKLRLRLPIYDHAPYGSFALPKKSGVSNSISGAFPTAC
ncbi:MAG: hypothetical protein U0L71_06665 [Eggerthellaceae bacterium]|nr:hypothetical protein [Eggerthellaceae bacterium]